MNGRFVRLAETGRANVTIFVDGEAVTALAGDTLMVAMLGRGRHRGSLSIIKINSDDLLNLYYLLKTIKEEEGDYGKNNSNS